MLPCRLCCISVLLVLLHAASAQPVWLSSPDGHLEASVFLDAGSRLSYSIRLEGRVLVATSPLGITVEGTDLGLAPVMGQVTRVEEVNESYPWKGVHDTAVNHYKGLMLQLLNGPTGRVFLLELRAFDQGLAFRYVVPGRPGNRGRDSLLVQGEATGWNLPGHSTLWFQENTDYYEGLYQSGLVSRLGPRHMGPPATFRTPDGFYGAITEAALYNYSGMSLRLDERGALHADFLHDPHGWRVADSICSPWRVVLAGRNLHELVNADIIYDLNPPPAPELAHAAWIRPGRAVWSYFRHDNVKDLSTEKQYVERASRLGFEYSIVDAGWEWAWPAKWDSLRQLVAYGQARKVGIWVWKSYASLVADSVRLPFFRQLSELGVAGVKIDFIDREGIGQVRFYEQALRDAAAFHLMVDFHGADKPTGYQRRFPNELTREAVYGQEWRTFTPLGPANNVLLPFTRMLAGPADYTPGVFESSLAYGVSRTHQLALTIIYNSPLMCWAEDPATYLASPAAGLIRSIPVVWDETRVLPCSEMGKTAAFARRKGRDWYVGISHAGPATTLTLSLEFLGAGHFDGVISRDDLTNADQLFMTRSDFSAADSVVVSLNNNGGWAARFSAVSKPGMSLWIRPGGNYLTAPVAASLVAGLAGSAPGGVDIRYTLDGSEPGPRSPLYTRPLQIGRPVLIKANLFRADTALTARAVAQFLAYPAPSIEPASSLFIGSGVVQIKDPGNHRIVYTLDGSVPVKSSPVYTGPILLRRSATVRARVLFPSGIPGAVALKSFMKKTPSDPVGTPALHPGLPSGLHYRFFKGTWVKIPDLKGLRAASEGTAAAVGLQMVGPEEPYYCLEFSGYINIPLTGVYTFSTLSDDGSRLWVDDTPVVDNDGCHGDLERSGEAALRAGRHRFRLVYFQDGSGQTLKAYIQGPGMVREEIPPLLFFH